MNNTIMHDPVLLSTLIDVYFGMQEKSKLSPTVPGLALAIGFNRSGDIAQVLTTYDQGQTVYSYPDDSVYLLMKAVTRIEDYCLQHGLRNALSPALVKFCLGAYHDRAEKTPQLQPGQPGATNQLVVILQAPEQKQMGNTSHQQIIDLIPEQDRNYQTPSRQLTHAEILPN